ncbi:TM2 domain-containing protein [Kribbella sp. NPDC004536]|uniref:TM2 domain-containing protein n=1 Tax=Kribbella sp. NPDC004536 TaxID=3364106 RepID=UPI00368DF5D3
MSYQGQLPQDPMHYPGYGAPYPAPFGHDPYGRPYSDKSRNVAGVLQLFFGVWGVGRFYTGHIGIAIGQLLTFGGLGIWSLIDGLVLLLKDTNTDSKGRPLRLTVSSTPQVIAPVLPNPSQEYRG